MSDASAEKGADDIEFLKNEVADLERRLQEAKGRLARQASSDGGGDQDGNTSRLDIGYFPTQLSAHHYLLLLSDSALPLGSFAFSSGLESYLAHTKTSATTRQHPSPSFTTFFLTLSLSSYASTTLPFVLAAHRDPSTVVDLDDALDAAIICTVGRRASIAQGRALLSIWERSLSAPGTGVSQSSIDLLKPFSALLRSSSSSSTSTESDLPPPVSAHLGPLFGAVSSLLGLTLPQTAYIFLLSHVKALISAAVRASIFGPYQAQKVLASTQVQGLITALVDREWDTRVEEAGQCVPVMDLWIGRHEMLYSRIFNS